VEPLAKSRQAIALEMQGPGRTTDTDRRMTLATMGDDIAALLDYLKILKADLVGLRDVCRFDCVSSSSGSTQSSFPCSVAK
jgi:hypothetical protein